MEENDVDFVTLLSREFSLKPQQVQAAIELLDAGNTIPFIARYRKEATGSLDDQVLRELAERLEYLRGLEKRREEIEKTLTELGVLTEELSGQLRSASTLSELEDLYRPYRPKRRTRATVAKERGLEPLALRLMMQQMKDVPEELAKEFVNPEKDVPDAESALAGARDILAETVSDSAEIRKDLREMISREGVLTSKAAKEEDSVYSMYYDYREPVRTMASHRVLAVNRGEREEFLKVTLEAPEEKALFSGDTLFQESMGRTDFPTGDQMAILESISQTLMELPDETKVYAGHEGESTIGHERKYNPAVVLYGRFF